MTTPRYASDTLVSVDKSQAELVALLRRHGATQHAFVADFGGGRAAVLFTIWAPAWCLVTVKTLNAAQADRLGR